MGEPLLRHFPWRWALYWLIAPNLAVVAMWPIGGPSMGQPLLVAGCIGLICSQAPWLWFRRISGVMLTLAMVVFYLSRNFNIDPINVGMVPVFFREAAPAHSPLYVAGGALVLLSIWIVARNAPAVPRFALPMNWLLGFLAVLGVIRFDSFATAATRGSYDLASASLPFASATASSGHAIPSGNRRHFVVILVEALGVPQSPAAAGLFAADWNRTEWRRRYAVRTGVVPYFGSTSNAEMRELCGVWSPAQVADFSQVDCLPARYRRAGYRTVGYHAFTGEFFNRQSWWRAAGIERTMFRDDLLRAGARPCGGVFPGACDSDIPAMIGAGLKAANQPQLVYWVTLNSHLPVVEEDALGTTNCAYGGQPLAEESPLLCPLFLVHHNLADAITKLALDPALPPTDFLIVGDHMPPYFERSARARFDGFHVPWILLQSRDAVQDGHSSQRLR